MNTSTPPSSQSRLRRAGVLGTAGTLATGSVAALLTALAAAPAGAAPNTFTVDSNADSLPGVASNCTDGVVGNCTLRDAAAAAQNGDTIDFAAGIAAITISTSAIHFNAVNLTGPGASSLTVSTGFAAKTGDAFYFGGTGNVTVSGLTVTTNRINARNAGNISLDHVDVRSSAATNGAGLNAENTGDLTITNSTFASNRADSLGGAVYAHNTGAVTITDSTFDQNTANSSGGAILVMNSATGDFTMERSTVTGNIALYVGGGLYVHNLGKATTADSDSTPRSRATTPTRAACSTTTAPARST